MHECIVQMPQACQRTKTHESCTTGTLKFLFDATGQDPRRSPGQYFCEAIGSTTDALGLGHGQETINSNKVTLLVGKSNSPRHIYQNDVQLGC